MNMDKPFDVTKAPWISQTIGRILRKMPKSSMHLIIDEPYSMKTDTTKKPKTVITLRNSKKVIRVLSGRIDELNNQITQLESEKAKSLSSRLESDRRFRYSIHDLRFEITSLKDMADEFAKASEERDFANVVRAYDLHTIMIHNQNAVSKIFNDQREAHEARVRKNRQAADMTNQCGVQKHQIDEADNH